MFQLEAVGKADHGLHAALTKVRAGCVFLCVSVGDNGLGSTGHHTKLVISVLYYLYYKGHGIQCRIVALLHGKLGCDSWGI